MSGGSSRPPFLSMTCAGALAITGIFHGHEQIWIYMIQAYNSSSSIICLSSLLDEPALTSFTSCHLNTARCCLPFFAICVCDDLASSECNRCRSHDVPAAPPSWEMNAKRLHKSDIGGSWQGRGDLAICRSERSQTQPFEPDNTNTSPC